MDIWYTLHYGNFNKENAGKLSHQLDLGVYTFFETHLSLLLGFHPVAAVHSPRKFKESYAQLLEKCPFLKRWSGVPEHMLRLGHSFTTDALGNRCRTASGRKAWCGWLWMFSLFCLLIFGIQSRHYVWLVIRTGCIFPAGGSVLEVVGRVFGVPNSLKNTLWFSGPVLVAIKYVSGQSHRCLVLPLSLPASCCFVNEKATFFSFGGSADSSGSKQKSGRACVLGGFGQSWPSR